MCYKNSIKKEVQKAGVNPAKLCFYFFRSFQLSLSFCDISKKISIMKWPSLMAKKYVVILINKKFRRLRSWMQTVGKIERISFIGTSTASGLKSEEVVLMWKQLIWGTCFNIFEKIGRNFYNKLGRTRQKFLHSTEKILRLRITISNLWIQKFQEP